MTHVAERGDGGRGGRRVVVTGYGAVTPLGLGVRATWTAMLAGRSGIDTVDTIDVTGLGVRIGGQVRGFTPGRYMPAPVSRRADPCAQYALAAAVEACDHAGLVVDDRLAPRVAVIIGSGYGPVGSIYRAANTLRDKGPRGIGPFTQVTTAMDSAACEISMRFGTQGPSRAQSTACASGADAVGAAMRMISGGEADVVLAGGADACVTAVDLAGSGNARALSRRNDDPAAASRPFDAHRDGFVMSEGAAVLVLEAAEVAERRGATALAELAGYGASSDAHHWTAPHPQGRGACLAVEAALRDAGITGADVDYVNAHGTGTPLNDVTETAVLRTVLGDRITRIPVSSTKSMTGHMIGAAGAVELVASILVLRTGDVPPTINCDDPIAPDINFVPHRAQHHDRVRIALSNSFGFGGHNAALVIRAV
ncbi:beta-ketoacyl-[acyl-carrier-protein] synthase II [Streptomyces griseoviridis]|uniref:3-oxoacyl-[acyl-carrier-protein] synthase 2 n=1 Tax=Streptomyces griseoviridis TaxID=45398 RepID=A0A3S9Z932_STRGD|nr:beta-ketoacyl-ACP synthase II [Streptomyces griseoviridis]AZS84189.1 beta-ketoacyl-[acyl-carrier-protein] synthase II [Streptomyces griseoviridis]QCN88952.1 beta-ketoacyl-[acyl-carrier-protein] synthase II [Streptomyces griseoviridis]